MQNQLLILIDGNALVHRSFHAIQQPLTVSSTGEDVRAVYGFTNALLRTISEWEPTHVVVTFDLPTPTFRHDLFDEYKAHRPPTPPELRPQFDRVRDVVRAFEIPIFELGGFEADDLLGTLCSQAETKNLETLILTGDSDTLQLVSEKVKVLMNSSSRRTSLYNIDEVENRYGGLGPQYVAQIKALQGDSSDNVPGVPGIGIKTAINLLTKYGSIKGIYDNIDDVSPPRAKKSLESNKEVADRALTLTTIRRDAPIELNLDKAEFGTYKREEVVSLLGELEFHSILPRIPNVLTTNDQDKSDTAQMSFFSEEQEKTDYKIVDTEMAFEELISAIKTDTGFSFDTETTSINPMNCELVGISFSVDAGKGWYIPISHKDGTQLSKNSVLSRLSPIFSDTTTPVRAHNANYDITVLRENGIFVEGLEFDTMIAAHVAGGRNPGLKDLALDRFGHEMTPITELIGSGKNQITMSEVSIEKAAKYASADADYTERLHSILRKELEQKEILGLFSNVEIPLIPVLVKMQQNGVALNVELLSEMSSELLEHMNSIKTEMFELIGHEFNLNSPKQLSDLLFSQLNLPTTRKTKSGFSTNAQSLHDLKFKLDMGYSENADPRSYEVLNRILEYREVAKIKSTYVDALPTMVNAKTGRVHTTYRQTGTSTGRLSSNDPNVQNIPVRTELGRRVREAFIADRDQNNILVAADYSQIELRVLAHYSRDEGLMNAFHNNEDIHSSTGSLVYGVPIPEVAPDMRRIAKVLNFGVIYGLSPHGISQQTDLTQKEGKKFIDLYFSKYPGIQKYLDGVKDQCRQNGYVETILGRRRYLPDINSRNFRFRSQAERAAINMPIQGTAADIIKVAMINIQKRLDELKMNSKMILQVHDELIFEAPNNEVTQLNSIISELMPSALKLDVPITIDTKMGSTWGTLK